MPEGVGATPLVDFGRLPNLRELIVPDEGYTIVDMDLDRADLWVVARESGDEALTMKLEAERRDASNDIHTQNAVTLFGSCDYAKRRFAKIFCHGANYGASDDALAKQCGVSRGDAGVAKMKWFLAHPGIARWQERIKTQVGRTRQVANKFGYRRYFFGRPDDAYNEALAWVPASTVAIVAHMAFCNICENLPEVQVLINGHDSLTMQVRHDRVAAMIPLIREQSEIVVPYELPLVIPVGFAVSNESWGKVKDYKV